jgi:hypothetical protein
VKSQVEGKMKQAAGAAQDLYGQARDTAEDAVRTVRKQASSFEETLRDTIENRRRTCSSPASGSRTRLHAFTQGTSYPSPNSAVAVALAVGWLIGRMGRSYG